MHLTISEKYEHYRSNITMYLEYFKLKEFPFLSSPDSRFLYLADQVNETFQKCL